MRSSTHHEQRRTHAEELHRARREAAVARERYAQQRQTAIATHGMLR